MIWWFMCDINILDETTKAVKKIMEKLKASVLKWIIILRIYMWGNSKKSSLSPDENYCALPAELVQEIHKQ